MVVFANLTGKWIELGDNDYIEDMPSEIYVNEKLSNQNDFSSNNFLKIEHDKFIYNVHISQIQWLNDRY